MVGWHHQLNGHEFKQTPGDGEGQGGLACCSPWADKESDMTERLNNQARSVIKTMVTLTGLSLRTRLCFTCVAF